MAAFQGHPNISPAEFAVLHQQHQQQQAMLYQAQQDFEKQQREGGYAYLSPPATVVRGFSPVLAQLEVHMHLQFCGLPCVDCQIAPKIQQISL